MTLILGVIAFIMLQVVSEMEIIDGTAIAFYAIFTFLGLVSGAVLEYTQWKE